MRALICLCVFCLLAVAHPAPGADFFSRDKAADYRLGAEVVQSPNLEADPATARQGLEEALRLRQSAPERAFEVAKRAMFQCIRAWMRLQNPAQARTPEQETSARVTLGELRGFFGWDKERLDAAVAGIGDILDDVLTAKDAREIISRQGVDPKEEAAARALEKR